MVKASLRTKSVGTKVSDAEYAALEARARAANLTLSEWVRARLLEPDTDGGSGRPGGGAADEVVLAEVLALRALFLNLRPLSRHALPGEGMFGRRSRGWMRPRCSARGSGWRRSLKQERLPTWWMDLVCFFLYTSLTASVALYLGS